MSQVRAKQPDSPNPEVGYGKILMLIGLISVAGLLIYNVYQRDSGESNIPRAMQMTYIPTDFKMNVDEQKTLEILSNPQRYKQEFDELILNFNTNLVVHVANRMGLNNQLRSAAVNEYRKMHPYIRQMYFNDFIGLTDTSSQIYQTWYENQGATAVDLLNEVASKYTCFFITSIMATVLKTQDGKISVKGNRVETPCGIALSEGLRPMVKRLQDAAAIRDFSRAKGMLKEKVEKGISELAVMEVRDKKGINVNNATKMWGYSVSSTNVDITAISVIKVGYNLSQYLDISVDDRNKTVLITLPQPQILSHEVFPKVENLDVGWLRELSTQDFNENINKLRMAFRDEALNSDIFNKARNRAGDVMNLILSPVVRNISKNYKIAVRFQGGNEVLDYNLPNQNGGTRNTRPTAQQTPQPAQQPQRLDGQAAPPQYYKPSTKQ